MNYLDKSELSNRATVLLVSAVAFLSFLTGILNIGMTTVTGPFSQFIPLWLQQTAGFTGVITGFLMLAGIFGLKKRLREAWILTIVLLPLTLLQGFIQSNLLSMPLIILSAAAIPSLLYKRKMFDQKSSMSPTQLAALTAVIGVQIYGTVGAYALREGFNQNLTLIDALYFSIITSSTVGYGDIYPVTPEARLFGITIVVLGTASFAAAIGLLFSPLIESKLAKKFEDLEEDILEEVSESS